jgi:hypothetical protein
MTEIEGMPDPMPKDPKRRDEIEFVMDQMRQQEISERGNAEEDVDLGTPPQEVLQELGGLHGAEDIVGKDKAVELQQLAVAGPSRDVAADDPEQIEEMDLMSKVMEKDAAEATKEAYDRVLAGTPAQEVLDDLGGAEEAHRIIGERATSALENLSKQPKGEQHE